MRTTTGLDPAVLASLHDLAGGDGTFVQKLFETYFEQSAATIDAVQIALERSDMAAAGREAHRLAGASLNVGATSAASLCRGIEDAASRGSQHDMRDCLIGLVAECAALRQEIG